MKISLLKIISFSLLFFTLLIFSAQAASPGNVVINEIAWMGTENSANDEWIELYNNSQNPLNLGGWVLKSGDGTPEINLTGTIPAKGFYLLERTDDNTVPEIPADLIYKGALSNDGEDLKLFDNSGNLIDETNCSSGWFAGDNSTKQTMERTDSGDWQTSQNPGGTPKTENSKQITENKEQKTEKLAENSSLPTEKLAENGSPQIKPVSYPSGILFNEILPSPEGADAENEWIEIKNQNNFEVNLSEWKIKDQEGKITTYTFPPDTKISPLGYLVLKRPETKITLNNDGDGLSLIYPNREIADSVAFEKAPLGQSYNKTPSGWFWSTILTPGAENTVPFPKPPIEMVNKEKTEVGPPQIESIAEKETAAVGEKLSKSSNYALLVAFAIAIFSAIVILILKKTATKNV